ncbi:MAG: bacteriophage abortive infection AbiH family protein [Prevotella sp.]|nr:bacteriophage abortive infection AbiH family protein [Prevotella sp.]
MDTLYIVGNGFDIHHGIKSSYRDFHQWIKHESVNNVRFAFTVFQLEKFFNDNCILWSDFEHNMGEYDVETVANQRFGLFPEALVIEDIEGMNDIVISSGLSYLDSLSETLTSVFRKWIKTIETDKEPDMSLSDSALYLTFNYTDTLEKLYGIPFSNILHIHGSILSEETPLIVGHNHKVDPLSVAIKGNDFRDNNERIDRICEMNSLVKPCYEIIERNSFFFEKLNTISQIVVLGVSYNDIDLPYFRKVKASVLPDAVWKMGWHTKKDKDKIDNYQHVLRLAGEKTLQFQF